jgi:endo-1,4-beta-xylanase
LTWLKNITFTGTHQATAGIVTAKVYGWSQNPLVEYYIIEDNTSGCQLGGGGAAGGSKGTFTVDGSRIRLHHL